MLTVCNIRVPKYDMKTGNPAWRFIIIPLLLIAGTAACQQPQLPAENASDNVSLQTIYEIPEGTAPQRPETYDDIILCESLFAYRANCPYMVHIMGEPDRKPGPDFVREAEVVLSGCKHAPRVTYRDYIETKAGEIRYNIFGVGLEDSSLRVEIGEIYARTRKPVINYEIKLRGTSPDIQVKKVGEGDPPTGPFVGDKLFYLMIKISTQIKPGNYTLHFIVEANGQNCGELPCVIHVTK